MATQYPTSPAPASRDIGPLLRGAMIAGGVAITALTVAAIGRWALGFSPDVGAARQVAVGIHLVAVVPAVPLGLVVMLRRKGGATHRLLGRIWMALMFVTAVSAIFIRDLNGGGFSFLHLVVPIALVTIVRAIAAARQGRIEAHKRMMARFYLAALVLPGAFAFLPGRVMWAWLLG